jgi:hypothetical protein
MWKNQRKRVKFTSVETGIGAAPIQSRIGTAHGAVATAGTQLCFAICWSTSRNNKKLITALKPDNSARNCYGTEHPPVKFVPEPRLPLLAAKLLLARLKSVPESEEM